MIEIDTDAKVVSIGAEFKPPPDGELMLVNAPQACAHWPSSFEIDAKRAIAICKLCGASVSPWFVLDQLARDESIWQRNRKAYLEDTRRLNERSKTKCQHCHKMTRISR